PPLPPPDRMMQQAPVPIVPQPVPPVQAPEMPLSALGVPVDHRIVSPIVVVDASFRDGRICCNFATMTNMRRMTSYQQIGGQAHPVTSLVESSIQEQRCYDLKAVEVFGVDQKRIGEQELATRLAKETQAIFVEGRRFDARMLGLLKPDSLVI